jgi:hypothetical protein
MSTTQPAKTADQCGVRIIAALEFETPIQQVTYDDADYPDLVPTSEQNAVIKKCYKLVILFVVIVAAISINLGSILGLNDAAAPALPMTPMDVFKRNLPAYSLMMAQTNGSSPQAKALMWLQDDSDYELYRLNQRYALAVVYYSAKRPWWNGGLEWLSNSSECGWDIGHKLKCDALSRLLSLDLSQVRIIGSIPRELELLTDLQSLSVGLMSGPIHSELYVP